ncbi:organic cation transporter protein [Nephila pilipes]|uniref:Organic cation transporter protein n=1 Tax=Nephila pilipes TaxID=299642 RepID=A0A8X6TFY8_NEPPI|nr:organic cation transporter protein [Nephila pilipes]
MTSPESMDCQVSAKLLAKMDMFEAIGSFGPWQRRVFFIFFYINIVGIWQNLAITFFAPNMDFRCVEPAIQKDNETNGTLYNNFCEVPLSEANDSTPCTKWEYDTSYFSQTIVSEWDLVCSREWLVSLAKSIYMVGFLISVIFFGQLSDSVGRFTAVAISYIITVVSMLLALLSTSFTMFLILRFLQAFGRTGLTTVGFVLVMELVGPQHRTETGIAIQIGWAIGFSSLAAVAWLFRHWFWFQVALSVPILPLAFAYRIVPESPRWLLMKGKTTELEKMLRNAAKINGREIKGDLKDILMVDDKAEEEKQKTRTLFDVLKMPKMRNRTFNMIYLWMVNSFMYYGLSFNTNDLAGNPYLNFFVAGALEFPSYALLFWGIKKWGRRPTLIALMFVGGAACVAIVPVPEDLPWLSTSFAMAGKFCVTGSFGLLYLYTSELFPTVVRNVTLGSCSMCARIGSILAPFVRELGKATHPAVPNVLYGLLALTSGLLALLLPETRGMNMPDSMEDGENFGRFSKEKDSPNGCLEERPTTATSSHL